MKCDAPGCPSDAFWEKNAKLVAGGSFRKTQGFLVCSKHRWRMMHYQSFDLPEGEKQSPRGEINYDIDITYRGAHNRTEYHRGKASEYDCVECGGAAEAWALIHQKSKYHFECEWRGKMTVASKSPWDYQPMCRSCHTNYDNKNRFGDEL